MWPATTLDDSDWDGNRARGWSVTTVLREKQRRRLDAARDARDRLGRDASLSHMMTPGVIQRQMRDEIVARWQGGFTTLVFVFALPGSRTMNLLDERGAYFDARSGDTWDAFFAGYYRSSTPHIEEQVGSRLVAVGSEHTKDWYFNARDFDLFRGEVELASAGAWRYSGSSDIVAVSAWVPEQGRPVIDWASLVSGTLTEPLDGNVTMSFAQAVETISRDLELQIEDPQFGLGGLTTTSSDAPTDSTSKKVMISALASFIAALGKKAVGLE